jgi:hypothetical protein
LLTLALIATGCAPAGGPAGPLTPLVLGTEQHVAIEWHAEPSPGSTLVRGYVVNHSPYTFDRVRVLVDALDAAGQIIGQRIVWAPGLLGSWGRNYFEAPMVPTPTYRVRVFAYDRIETGGGIRRWPFP